MNIGDRVRIVPYHTWRNAFGVIVWRNAYGECWVKLIQPTRRPSYRESWGTLIPQRMLNSLIFSDVTVVRVP